MGKSQTRRLREATMRFGREDRNRLAVAKAILSELVHARKVEAGLVAPKVISLASTGTALVKRYSTSLSHQQNESTYGRPRT